MADNAPPPGVVWADRVKDGWYFVQLGRHRGPKRFNLSDAEARQLVTRLAALGITAEPAEPAEAG